MAFIKIAKKIIAKAKENKILKQNNIFLAIIQRYKVVNNTNQLFFPKILVIYLSYTYIFSYNFHSFSSYIRCWVINNQCDKVEVLKCFFNSFNISICSLRTIFVDHTHYERKTDSFIIVMQVHLFTKICMEFI